MIRRSCLLLAIAALALAASGVQAQQHRPVHHNSGNAGGMSAKQRQAMTKLWMQRQNEARMKQKYYDDRWSRLNNEMRAKRGMDKANAAAKAQAGTAAATAPATTTPATTQPGPTPATTGTTKAKAAGSTTATAPKTPPSQRSYLDAVSR